MKKILLSILCTLFCLCAGAQSEKTYTEHYVVKTNGVVTNEADADVTIVDNGNGTINFVLKEFTVTIGNEPTNVGDISLEGVPVTEGENGLKHFTDEGRTFTIPAEKLPADFRPYAFAFQSIPYTLQGKLNDTKLYATINIDMSTLGQSISVEVGTDDFLKPGETRYKDLLLVSVNGSQTTPQITDISVFDNGDGTINFALNNFILEQEGMKIPVGNIALNNLATEASEDGMKHFSYDGNLIIEAGDPAVAEGWIGPALSSEEGLPVKLEGRLSEDQLFVSINIEIPGMTILVNLIPVKVYTDQLLVSLNENPLEPQVTDVTVGDNGDGSINFLLKNFVLMTEGEPMGVGNIFIQNLVLEKGEDGLLHFSYNGNLTITAGDPEVCESWAGPLLGEIPLNLTGKMNADKLFVTIDIPFGDLAVFVQFGTDAFPPAGKDGDANGDGEVDIADVTYILGVMASGSKEAVADINGDGEVDIADVTRVLTIMANQ